MLRPAFKPPKLLVNDVLMPPPPPRKELPPPVVAPPKLNWDVGWACVVAEPKRPPVVAPVVAVYKNNLN